jgi:type 1 glutamine amidotransferase
VKKAFSLVGDFYHNHDLMFETLNEVLSSINIELIDVDIKNFLTSIKERPYILVIGRENRINPEEKDIKVWMGSDIEEEIVRYVENGGRLFVWHSGLSSYPKDGNFVKLIKGYFIYHPEKNKIVRYFSSDGSYDFKILDEHYFVYCDVKNTDVFLYSESEDGNSFAGWRHSYGKGEVICLTPAHREEGLKDINLRRLMREVLRGD